MKRFFVMILLVSSFFIGLGALIDGAKASLKSDAKALELIRLSRIAIGGEANINNVRSMSISANTTNYFDKNGAMATETGSLELSMQLPDQFSKMVRIGNPDENTGGEQKSIEIRVVKDSDGNVITEDIIGEPNHRVMVMKTGDGDTNTWTSKDGNKVVVEKDVRIENTSGQRNNELLRTTLSLLLTAPEGTDVAYTFGGEGTVDGSTCNIVLAQSNGQTFKLFLDKSTFLPRMISYNSEMPHIIMIKKDGNSEGKSVEHQLKFSDFRTVGGLLLPYRWAESVAGKQSQTVDVTAFEINPANIADKFKGEKVFIRKSQ